LAASSVDRGLSLLKSATVFLAASTALASAVWQLEFSQLGFGFGLGGSDVFRVYLR